MRGQGAALHLHSIWLEGVLIVGASAEVGGDSLSFSSRLNTFPAGARRTLMKHKGYRVSELTQCSQSLSALNQQQFLRERSLLSGTAGSRAGDRSDTAAVSGHARGAGRSVIIPRLTHASVSNQGAQGSPQELTMDGCFPWSAVTVCLRWRKCTPQAGDTAVSVVNSPHCLFQMCAGRSLLLRHARA